MLLRHRPHTARHQLPPPKPGGLIGAGGGGAGRGRRESPRRSRGTPRAPGTALATRLPGNRSDQPRPEPRLQPQIFTRHSPARPDNPTRESVFAIPGAPAQPRRSPPGAGSQGGLRLTRERNTLSTPSSLRRIKQPKAMGGPQRILRVCTPLPRGTAGCGGGKDRVEGRRRTSRRRPRV